MKHTFFSIALSLIVASSYAQSDSKTILTELGTLVDQYNRSFNPESGEKLTLIWVPGADDPFGKIYDKLKGRKLKKNSFVQFVGGFKESAARMGGDPASAKKHIQEAMVFRYGDNYFPILIDIESKIASNLSTTGYSIITLSKKSNKIVSKVDCGTDRKKFFDLLNTYFEK